MTSDSSSDGDISDHFPDPHHIVSLQKQLVSLYKQAYETNTDPSTHVHFRLFEMPEEMDEIEKRLSEFHGMTIPFETSVFCYLESRKYLSWASCPQERQTDILFTFQVEVLGLTFYDGPTEQLTGDAQGPAYEDESSLADASEEYMTSTLRLTCEICQDILSTNDDDNEALEFVRIIQETAKYQAQLRILQSDYRWVQGHDTMQAIVDDEDAFDEETRQLAAFRISRGGFIHS